MYVILFKLQTSLTQYAPSNNKSWYVGIELHLDQILIFGIGTTTQTTPTPPAAFYDVHLLPTFQTRIFRPVVVDVLLRFVVLPFTSFPSPKPPTALWREERGAQ